jgi:transcriptional regulator with XRE-family HTH domain
MSIQSLLGLNVRLNREGKGWSQDRLSEESGLHRTYISGVERGVRNPTIEVVQQLANALGICIEHLFTEPRVKKAKNDQ